MADYSESPMSDAAPRMDATDGETEFDPQRSIQATQRIRIVQVVNSLAPAGAEMLTTNLSNSLDPDKWDVHVLVVRGGQLRERIEQAGLPIYETGYAFDHTFPLALAKMVQYINAVEPCIVHTHLLGSDILGRIAAVLAGVPIIVSTQHDTYMRPLFYRWYQRYSARFITAQVAISDTVAEFCRTQLRTPEDKLHVISNGVEPSRFAAARTPWRDPPTFGAVGSLIPIKGHAYLIEAFAQVAKTIPGTRLLLAGDGSEREALQALAIKMGVSDSVHFEGMVSDIPAFLARIDVLVHPSMMEGLGIAVLEAMAAAKPVIASDIPALAEVLDGGRAGELVPSGDSDALARIMLKVIRNPQAACTMGRLAENRVINSYSLTSTVAQYSNLYSQLLEEAGLADGAAKPVTLKTWRPTTIWLWRLLRYGLLAAVGFLIYGSLQQGFEESSFIDLDFNPLLLGTSFVLFAAYYLSFINGLRLLFSTLGHKLPFSEVFKLSFMSNVGKYVPGGIWPIASRVALASKVGITPPEMLLASAFESALSVAGGSVVVLAAFALGVSAPAREPLLVIMAVSLAALAALHPAVLRFSMRLISRVLHADILVKDLPVHRSIPLALYYSVTWLIAGAAFYAFTRSILPDAVASPFAYAGYYAAGNIIGLVVLFAPGGLGAREGALVLLLTAPLGAAHGAVIALAVRVWTTLIELGLSLLAFALPFRRRDKESDAPEA
ncbi:MAG: glycosyltransferase [Coriobacteriia bacterium]|nr:glycosyltransferase [Coriobacteriia bacterium]